MLKSASGKTRKNGIFQHESFVHRSENETETERNRIGENRKTETVKRHNASQIFQHHTVSEAINKWQPT